MPNTNMFPPKKLKGAVLYLRVSTKRQLQGEVSIPSQRKGCTLHCLQIEKPVVGEFIDGATGTDDARPAFQRMIEEAKQPGCTFDTIVVYSRASTAPAQKWKFLFAAFTKRAFA